MQLSKRVLILWLSVVAGLISTFGFVLDMDQGMFIHGGRVLLSGGTLYYDVFDVKPPLIHELYAIGLLLPFDNPLTCIHILDAFWHVATLWILYRLTAAIGFVGQAATLATYVAILLMAAQGGVMQAETFVALPIATLLLVHDWDCGMRRTTIRALAVGAAVALKPTFLVVGIAVVISDLIAGRKCIRWLIPEIAMWSVVPVLSMLPVLLRPHGSEALGNLLSYMTSFGLSGTSAIERSPSSYIIDAFATLHTAVSITVALIVVMWFKTKERMSLSINQLTMWLLVLLSISIIVEAKFHPYHYLRLLSPLSIACAVGITQLSKWLRKAWDRRTVVWRTFIGAGLIVAILLSPLPRSGFKLFLGASQIMGFGLFDKYLQHRGRPGDDKLLYRNVANYVNELPVGSRPIIVSIRAGLVTPWLTHWQYTRASSAQYMHGYQIPVEWRHKLQDDIAQATHLIVDTLDQTPELVGHNASSYGMILSTTPWREAALAYRIVDTVETFIVFARAGGTLP